MSVTSSRLTKNPQLSLRLIPIIFIGALFYWGYCWGWWGSESQFLAYFFQCKCPGVSADHRFGEEFDVLVPSCDKGRVKDVSHDGKLVLVTFIGDDKKPFEVFDLENDVVYQGKDYDISEGFLLPDEKLLVVSTRTKDAFIYDIKTQSVFELSWIHKLLPKNLSSNSVPDGELEENLFNELDKYDQFFISDNCLFAYSSDAYIGSFVLCKNHFDISYIPRIAQLQWEDFLAYVESDVNNSVAYYRIGCDQHHESCRSYSGDFVESGHQIRLFYGGEKIADRNFPWDDSYFVQHDWVFDDRGYLMGGGTTYLIEGFIFNFGKVEEPILIRLLPDEYQSPASLEKIIEQRAEREWQQAFAVLVGVLIVATGALVFNSTRKEFATDYPQNTVSLVQHYPNRPWVKVFIINTKDKHLKTLKTKGGKRHSIFAPTISFFCDDENELASLFSFLRDLGFAFLVSRRSYGPSEIFAHLREEQLLSGKCKQVVWNIKDKQWGVIEEEEI